MQTMRRFLALTPLAFGITAVVLVYLQNREDFSWGGVWLGVVSAVIVTVGAFLMILAGAALLRLLAVRSDWAALGTGLILATVLLAVCYAAVAASLPAGDEGWSLLYVVGPAVASIPVWPAYAVGLLVRGWRGRTSRRRPGSAAGPRNA
ncbi:hypothetical protein [Promicromonospora kroppenstedtii]|uniref:hypothetical protein n=1 Tax=Promicromonospora kroppenstedtii TaxID=440482 RepID=UPI0012F75604|nr:hypothetical protein [Promicromonospora kroppenstedtii]